MTKVLWAINCLLTIPYERALIILLLLLRLLRRLLLMTLLPRFPRLLLLYYYTPHGWLAGCFEYLPTTTTKHEHIPNAKRSESCAARRQEKKQSCVSLLRDPRDPKDRSQPFRCTHMHASSMCLLRDPKDRSRPFRCTLRGPKD